MGQQELHEFQQGQMQSPTPEKEEAPCNWTGWGLAGWEATLWKRTWGAW